jgi:hypothetical protein
MDAALASMGAARASLCSDAGLKKIRSTEWRHILVLTWAQTSCGLGGCPNVHPAGCQRWSSALPFISVSQSLIKISGQ